LVGIFYAEFSLAQADPNVCAAACSVDPLCRAFTYTAPGVRQATPQCMLKEDMPSPSPFVGATSGVKHGLEQNTDRIGGDYASFAQAYPVPEECQAACAQDPNCKAFTFVPPGWYGSNPYASCLLKASVGSLASGTGL